MSTRAVPADDTYREVGHRRIAAGEAPAPP
jgi:hypothetical protein